MNEPQNEIKENSTTNVITYDFYVLCGKKNLLLFETLVCYD